MMRKNFGLMIIAIGLLWSTNSMAQDCPVEGQIRRECASACNITCADVNTTVICPEVCISNGCQCPNDTVIDEQTNMCVAPSNCSSTEASCPVGGQTRRECASACSITCADVNTTVACPGVCVVNGCQCPNDTVIDEQTNMCVAPSECPSTEASCPIEGQTRMECASACNITCANVNTTVLCPQVCVVNGCQCPSGTVIDEQTNTCIAPSNCPLTEDCPVVGQTRVECASACNTTCANVNTTVICPQVCVANGCQCPNGTVIDEQTNTCIAPSNCPLTEDCPVEGQTRMECASACNITCANVNTTVICPQVCVANGCQCPNGTVIDEQTNTCIAPSNCPLTEDCPVEGQTRMECASACNITCANVNTTVICPQVCVVNGCQCPVGTVIDEQTNKCVAPSECPSAGTSDGAGSGTAVFAGVITTLLCSLLSIFL